MIYHLETSFKNTEHLIGQYSNASIKLTNSKAAFLTGSDKNSAYHNFISKTQKSSQQEEYLSNNKHGYHRSSSEIK